VRHRRDRTLWLLAPGVVLFGVVLGASLAGVEPLLVLGSVTAVIGLAAVIGYPAFGLALLAFTYPFDLTTFAGPVKLTTSAALMGVLLAGWAVRQLLAVRVSWRRTPLDLPVLLFAAASVLSLAGLAGHVNDQLVGLLKAGGGLLIFFLITQTLRSRRDVWLVVVAVLATGALQAGQLTLSLLTGTQGLTDMPRATGTLIDPNLFAGYLVLMTPLVAAVGLALPLRFSAIPTALAVTALSIALVATLSRSGWLGFLTSAIVLAALMRRRRLHIVLGGAGIGAVIFIAGLTGAIGSRLASSSTGPLEMLSSRWDVWSAAAGIFLSHPLFGVGVANFVNFYPEYSHQPYGLNHAHNLLLNIAAERGIVGLVTFCVVMVVLLRGVVRGSASNTDRLDRALGAGLIASFAGFLVHSTFEVSYYDYKVLLLFWLLAGIAAVLSLDSSTSERLTVARAPTGNGRQGPLVTEEAVDH
jgi:putative inorganic carbon (hco3(-)) transporter